MIAYTSGDGAGAAEDPIDRINSKPDFQMLVYPGGNVPDKIPPDAPPAFLLVANDDDYGCDKVTLDLYQKLHAAGVRVEAIFRAQGRHAFNMGDRSNLVAVNTWPQRMADWLNDSGYLTPAGATKATGKHSSVFHKHFRTVIQRRDSRRRGELRGDAHADQ